MEKQPALALVDVNSFWVTGFFKENYIEGIGKGNTNTNKARKYSEARYLKEDPLLEIILTGEMPDVA